MQFTYGWYKLLVDSIKKEGYQLSFYDEYDRYAAPCILRHDIDFSIDKALDFALFEAQEGIISTYFVLLTSKMYNALSAENMDKIKRIANLGHRIGLHFDEARYEDRVLDDILFEKSILEKYVGVAITAISMHEPSRSFIESDLRIPGMINAYSRDFFEKMEYCSDSMRTWKKGIDELTKSGMIKQGLQVLTHPIWWNKEEKSRTEALTEVEDIVNSELCNYIIKYYPEHEGYTFVFKPTDFAD